MVGAGIEGAVVAAASAPAVGVRQICIVHSNK